MEFNSFGPAVGRLGSDSSRGPNSAPLVPLTLTTGYDMIGCSRSVTNKLQRVLNAAARVIAARCYASAVLAMSQCLSVSVSVCLLVCHKSESY